MRTQVEIAVRFETLNQRSAVDPLGFRREALAEWLDYEHVKPFLKEATTEAEWGAVVFTREALIERMREYMDFAWDKALGERGISASRSVDKFREWLWILDQDDLLQQYEAIRYEEYGKPHLTFVCRSLRFPIPIDD